MAVILMFCAREHLSHKKLLLRGAGRGPNSQSMEDCDQLEPH